MARPRNQSFTNTNAGKWNWSGKHVWKLHLPYKLIVRMLQLTEGTRLRLPIKAEQVLRLYENKAFSYEDAQRDFGFNPRSFEEGIGFEVGNFN